MGAGLPIRSATSSEGPPPGFTRTKVRERAKRAGQHLNRARGHRAAQPGLLCIGGNGYDSRVEPWVHIAHPAKAPRRARTGLLDVQQHNLERRSRSGSLRRVIGTAPENLDRAIAGLRDEIARIVENGVTEEELDIAKSYLTGSFAMRFQKNSQVAE